MVRARPGHSSSRWQQSMRNRHVRTSRSAAGLGLLQTNYRTGCDYLCCLLARLAENDTDDRGDHTCRPAYVWCSPRLSERTSRNQVDVALPAGEKTGAVQASARPAGPTAAKTNSRQDQQLARASKRRNSHHLLALAAQASLHAAGDRSNSGVGAFAVPYGSDDRAPVDEVRRGQNPGARRVHSRRYCRQYPQRNCLSPVLGNQSRSTWIRCVAMPSLR